MGDFSNVVLAIIGLLATLPLLAIGGIVVLNGGAVVGGSALAAAMLVIVGLYRAGRRRPAPNASVRIRRFGIGVFVVALAATATAFGVHMLRGRLRPAHADVVASFREHRADYEALRRMVTEDRLKNGLVGTSSFLTPSDTPANLALPPPRAAEYRSRMTAAGIRYIYASPNGAVEFNVANWRGGSYGWYVSVVSASEPPQPRIATIDRTESVPFPKGYADLGEGWYAGITWR